MTSFAINGAGWSHEVIVGPIRLAGDRLRSLSHGLAVPVVSDDRVLALHGDKLRQILDIVPIAVPEGEAAKDWTNLRFLTERFHELGVSRDRPVIAFGGGSVGDLAGLAASLFKRGCPIVHVSTTLLAQADSAVGGKTAIDACGQKNLVGAFHPPALVICDPAFLDTLDTRQLRSGYAEVVKYGLIDDSNFFAWCKENALALLAGDPSSRLHAIEYCLRAKARLIGDDLRDLAGKRALLNLGHTFGHAIEALAGIGPVLHGEAVAIGICLAFDLSSEIDLAPAKESRRVREHLASVGLPTRLADVGLGGRGSELLKLMRGDKKAGAGGIVLILARGIGQAFVARNVPEERIFACLNSAG